LQVLTNPLLSAQARRDPLQPELCTIPPESRYRGPENQLYRVEIHKGRRIGGTEQPTFKWSRENGSVVFPILRIDGSSVVLGYLGRDTSLGLKEGDWVEILDENYILQNRADPLLRVAKIDRDQLRVTLGGNPSVQDTGDNKVLRRWDHQGNPDFG